MNRLIVCQSNGNWVHPQA